MKKLSIRSNKFKRSCDKVTDSSCRIILRLEENNYFIYKQLFERVINMKETMDEKNNIKHYQMGNDSLLCLNFLENYIAFIVP